MFPNKKFCFLCHKILNKNYKVLNTNQIRNIPSKIIENRTLSNFLFETRRFDYIVCSDCYKN